MSVMFKGRSILVRLSTQSRLLQRRRLYNSNNNKPIIVENNNGKEVENVSRQDAYKQLENLDFMTAAKMLFTEPPNKKKFGIDFHLVQLFFACLPSLAVYLVAQYARHEMRRMEAEQEVKKKAEEEAKAKEQELMAEEEKKLTNPQLSEVKARLEKLEEAVKGIVVESKKQSGDVAVSNAVKKEPGTTEPGTPNAQEKTTSSSDRRNQGKASVPDQEQTKNGGSSHDTSK